WPAPNADIANTRHVGGPIERSSVARLRVAWTMPIGDYATTPVVVDGVVYTQDLQGDVYAIELASGRVRWRHRYGLLTYGPNGVTVGDGRVYGATTLFAFALDQDSGRELWQAALPRNEHEGIDMAPGFHDGTVFVSTVPTRPEVQYGPGAQGVLWALDAATGRPRWHWDTVPAELWGDPSVNSGGGLWYPPAFDARGHVFASVANPGPLPGTPEQPWGASRPGPNRWTNAIVKLDERTGRLLWGRQVLPHDIFDWDLACPVILRRAGGRELAVVAGKMGWVYAFDADDGALVWKRPVGRHNGHDDDNLRAMRGERMPARIRHLLPGQLGGVITPMAADARTVYVPVNELAARIDRQLMLPEEGPARGRMVALDLATGRVRWDRPLPAGEYGGATVANDVVFTTTYDGTVWALDARSGGVAWRARLPAGTNAPVAVAGDTVLAAGSLRQRAGQQTRLVAYRLGR
ncbi:MAG TPA: PQQ-binding-like beta-propeller repeat protein, partial [Conexibacter sp.]